MFTQTTKKSERIDIFTIFGLNQNLVRRKSHLKTALSTSKLVVDGNTGEVLEEDVKQIKYLVNDREQFFLVYASLLGLFQEMSAPEVKVYSYLLEHYITGSLIGLTKSIKEAIGEKLKLKLGTVNNAITKLNEKKLIYSSGKASYKINPRYAWKSSSKDRNEALKLVLQLECPNA